MTVLTNTFQLAYNATNYVKTYKQNQLHKHDVLLIFQRIASIKR